MNKSIASKLILKSPSCLSLLENCRNMVELKQIHAQILRTGFFQDNFVYSKILAFSALSNSPDCNYARMVFDHIEMPDTFIFNTMIRAYSRTRDPNEAISFYVRMLQRGNMPNRQSFTYVSKACSNLHDFRILMGIHGQTFGLGFDSDIFVLNSLIHAYSACGFVDFARNLFDEISQRDVIAWTSVIGGYVHSNRAREALEFFFSMENQNLKPDDVTMVMVITSCSQLKDLELGKRLEGLVGEIGAKSNPYVINSLIDMYAKCGVVSDSLRLFNAMLDKDVASWNSIIAGYTKSGDMKEAKKLFDKMPLRDSISWSSMVSGYSQNGAFNESLKVFHEMQAAGFEPTDAAVTSALASCAHLGALGYGQEIHHRLEETKIQSDVVLSTALVDMYMKCGCLEIACRIFNRIVNKNVVSWNVIIAGFAINGKAFKCLESFSKMLKDGFRPDSVTFVGVLSGCAHGGLLEEGKNYFDQMITVYGIHPRVEHCACMVNILGLAGHLEEAHEFIKTSPVKPDVVIWGALLNACKIHGCVELGEFAASHLLELDPHHGGAYVMLSNMYAAVNDWNKVTRVRKTMRERGITYRPGWSSIDVNGAVHEFLIGDGSHPEIQEILSMLGAMDFQMLLANPRDCDFLWLDKIKLREMVIEREI